MVARFAYEKRGAVNRYTFIMLKHLLISLVFPSASSLPGEVGNIFDFQGKKEPASRSEKDRGRRKATWWTFEAWNNTPNFRASPLGHDSALLSSLSFMIFFLSSSHFNFCPEPQFVFHVPSVEEWSWRWLGKISKSEKFHSIRTTTPIFFVNIFT